MNKKIAAIVSILLVFSFLFAFAGCDTTEEEVTTTTTITAKTPLPTDITTSYNEESQVVTDTTYSAEALKANTATIFEYFNLHINELKAVNASLNVSVDKNISKAKDAEGNDIAMSENEYIAAAVKSLSGYMLNEEGSSAEYGPLKDLLPVKGQDFVSALTLEEIESATCVDNGNVRTITVALKSPAELSTIEKAYDIGSVDAVLAEFEKAEKYITVSKAPVLTYKDCVIIINVDVETDEIFSIEYKKNIDVATEVTGQGTLADVGTTPVNFRYESTVKYELDRTAPEATEAAA